MELLVSYHMIRSASIKLKTTVAVIKNSFDAWNAHGVFWCRRSLEEARFTNRPDHEQVVLADDATCMVS